VEKIESKWLFPVRMENSKSIEWVEDIVEAFSKFKAPITQATWEHCLRRGVVGAGTPEHNKLLREWWNTGWQEMPILPAKWGGTPVMKITQQVLGQTLELIYPTIEKTCEALGCGFRAFRDIAQGIHPNRYFDGEVRPLRQIAAKELPYPPWTLFAADDTIIGYFQTKQEMADYLGIHHKIIDVAHNNNWNKLASGKWFWCERWGFMPISPDDEPLGSNWREKYSPDYSPGEI